MPFLFIGIPLLAVAVLNLWTWSERRSAMWMAMGAALLQICLAALDLYRCLVRRVPVESDFLGHFSVDLFSASVLLIIGLIGSVTILVAQATVKTHRFSFGSSVLLLMMGMNGTVMVTDVFSLYVFIEATAIASFLLIAINKKRDELEGAFKYYLMSAIATTLMLIAIALLFALVGDTSFNAVAAYIQSCQGSYSAALQAAFVLFTVALAIKSGAVPFHTWVPDAHSSAPSPVSVVLAGVVIKVSGVYALMRIYRDVFQNNPAIGRVLMVLGFASIVIGALGAMGQSDIKRMLAFSSVSQIGYIVLAAATGSTLGFVGAMAHFFNHATFKSLLFVNAASVYTQTGTRDMNRMGGLSVRMPITSASSVLGLLSMAGIPPLSGFWSKLLIVMAVWRISPGLAIATLCASVLTLAYFLILQKKVFYGKLAPGMEDVKECGPSICFVEALLAAINVGAGLVFPLMLHLLHARGIL